MNDDHGPPAGAAVKIKTRAHDPLRGVARLAQVTLKKGFDVDYYLDQVGVDYYLTAAGEPAGVWAGTAADRLGLSGLVDPDVMRALYHHDTGPDGTPLATSQKGPQYAARRTYQQVQEAIGKRVEAELGELAPRMPERVRKIRLEERAKTRTRTPYYDMTFSAEKSVSLAHAGLRAAARAARGAGREQEAEQLEARARSVEAAVMAGAEAMLSHAEQHGIVRTGHHSEHTGEYRDAGGFIAVKFLQHTSRSDDPQLHVQIPILNRAQRADGADGLWRAIDGRPLYAGRLGAAAYAGAAEAQALARLGLPLVKRPDGNGFEIGGVSQATMDAFSARTADIAGQLQERIAEYEQIYGRPPSRQALFRLRKRVTVETRAAKRKPPAAGQAGQEAAARAAETELQAWARKAADEQVQALESLHEQIEAYAAEHPEARTMGLPPEAERAQIMRAAVAEVQRQNASWTRAKLEWELYRQLPVLPRWADWGKYLSDMADDILGGRAAGVSVLQIAPAPDVVDVSRLGFRKDGTSIYRPPGEARYVTAEHLDLEEWVLRQSRAAAAQLVTEEAAAAALAGSALDFDQRAAACGLLASRQAVTSLVAPAGTGKTFVLAQFARAWMAETGGRVIGLTLAENAARVMAGEGMTEAHNIARFFARGVPVFRGDVLVVDEASQVSTADLARIINTARRAGARVVLAGDTGQLGPVEAGGMFALIAAESGHWKLAEVRRFTEAWEREASLKLRAGELEAWGEHGYGHHGRVHEGPRNRVHDQAVTSWLTDRGMGKDTLLLAGSNEEAARLAALVRARRIERGEIPGGREITLSDGNAAGTGDLVRARLNATIDAGGRRLANRDTLRVRGWLGSGTTWEAVVERQLSAAEAEADPATAELDAEIGRQRAMLHALKSRREAELEAAQPGDGWKVVLDPEVQQRETGLDALIDRRREEGGWSKPFTVPAAYLEENAELAYAGNVYVAQGRTVDTAHLVISEGMTRDMLYVGMTRGREKNSAHVVTGPPDPADLTRQERDAHQQAVIMEAAGLLERGDREAAHQAAAKIVPPEPDGMRERAPWEAVVAAAMERDEPEATAIEAIRAAQDFPANTRHLYEIAEAGWWLDVVPQIDQMVRERIGEHYYQRYLTDPERPAFLQELRAHEISGRRIADVLDAITARPLEGARSVAAVLHGRAGKEPAPARGQTRTWTERTPQAAPVHVQETYRELDSRQAELGEQLAGRPPQWALQAWGQPPAEPGALQADWKQRAAVVQSYRELAGITDPGQALGPAPARQAGLTEAFTAAVRVLELPDETALLKAMGRGELEARVRDYERAEAAAPPDLSAQIDHADDARKHSLEQSKAAALAGNETIARGAKQLARDVQTRAERLRIGAAARDEWAEANAAKAEAAAQAREELRRRGPARTEEARPGPAGTGRDLPAPDPAETARLHEAQAQLAAEIRQDNRTFPPEPETQAGRETPAPDPAAWARLKAEQTARADAGKAARSEASARAVPVTEAEIARYGPERAAPGPDPAEAARQREEQAERAAEIRRQNQALSRDPQPRAGRETPPMDPATWAELKTAQTARVEADRRERKEASARAVPATYEEIARYGAAAERLAEADPDAAADLEKIRASIDAAEAAISRNADAEASRAAELEEAGINEPVIYAGPEPEADAGPGAAWEPGSGPASPDRLASADTEADAGIET